MEQLKYNRLRDITQGDFAIRGGALLYNGKEVSSHGKLILSSVEEAFFMFEVERQDEDKFPFRQVFLLNGNYPYFYTSRECKIESTRFQFVSPENIKHAFHLISYNGCVLQTKIVGDAFAE